MEKIMRKIYPLLALFVLVNAAHAQNLLQAKLGAEDAASWNVGAGITQELLHLNAEWVNQYGIAYTKAGVFLDDDNPFGAQVGFRYPYYFTGEAKNGYYIGAYLGHLDSQFKNNEYKSRLGAGIDLAYVWLSPERISTLSVGLGAAEKFKNQAGEVTADTEPQLQFSYTLSFGLK